MFQQVSQHGKLSQLAMQNDSQMLCPKEKLLPNVDNEIAIRFRNQKMAPTIP